MAPIPEPSITIATLIDDAIAAQQREPRSHLGASQLGDKCDRKIWLNFRWVLESSFPGRILRLFRRGQLEERTVIDDLKLIGIEIDGSQTWIDFGGHVSGACDGIGIGVPNAPTKKFVLEIKTHSDKSWNEVCKKGVQEAHLTHWVQMQVYMLGLKLDRALYFAINKNTDEIYTEWVRLDKEVATKAIERAKRIALSDRMPEPLSADPEWYECKMCSHHSFCHVRTMANQVNCRTCAHSTAKPDGTWRCERFESDNIPLDFQRVGCDSHVLHPDIVPWPIDPDKSTKEIAAFKIGENQWLQNGEGDANVYTSHEIVALGERCLEPIVGEVRDIFDAVIDMTNAAYWGAIHEKII